MTRRLTFGLAGVLAAALLATAAPSVAQTAYPPMPAVGAPKPFSLPQMETYTLRNGLQVTLIPYGLTPKTVVSLRVPTGNIDDGENTWIADLTADMLREGAGSRSGTELAQAAASMGGGLQTSVNQFETGVSINVLSEHGPAAVGLISDVARRPTFPASEFGRVRDGRARQVAVARSQPGSQADVALAQAQYGADHPYGRVFPTDAQLAGFTVEQAKAFHAANYGARGARLYVAGQFDTAAMKAAIEQAFGDWAPGDGPTAAPATRDTPMQVLLVDRPGAAQSTLRLAFPAPAIGGQDDLEMRVTNTLLGGSFNSRITKNIREAKGYTYSPGSGLGYEDPQETNWVFNADVTTAVTGESLKEVFGEIRRLQTEAPSAAENAGAKTYLSGIYVLSNANAPGIVGQLAYADMMGLPRSWMDGYVPGVLAVTPAQMEEAAKAHLPLDKMTLVVVGDLATVRPQLEALPELQGATMQVVTP